MAERMLIGLSLLLIIKAPAVVVVGMWRYSLLDMELDFNQVFKELFSVFLR